jgi:hypothetical protein
LPAFARVVRGLAAALPLIVLSLMAPAQAAEAVRVEEGIAPQLRDTVERAATELLRLYESLLDVAPYAVPGLSVAWENRGDEERRVRVAREADGAIRVSLSGKDWADPPPEALAALAAAMASELARVWSSSIYRPDADVPAWVVDGNAELLGTAALLRLGLATPADAARRVNVALNTCFALAGGLPWNEVARAPSADVSRACGLAIHFVLVALAQRRDPAIDAFAFWRALWKAHPRYGARSIAEYAAPRMPDDAADFVPNVAGRSPAAVDASLARGIRSALGLELPRPPPEIYASHVLRSLMQHDCAAAGFWTNNDHLFTDALPGCRFFKGGWKIRYMAGRDLLREPAEAVREAKAACAREARIALRTLDEREFQMPCDAAVARVLPSDLRVANLPALRVARVLLKP